MTKPALRTEAIRLRVKGRRSFTEIHRLLGVSKGTLSIWLKPYQLTSIELRRRRNRKGIPFASTAELRQPTKYSDIYRAVKQNQLTGPQVAKVAETAVMLRLLVQGYSVYGSMFDGDRSDWLVETKKSIWKIQVKSVRHGITGLPNLTLKHGHSTKRGGRRYVKGEFDFIVGYDLRTDTAYVWSWKEVQHLSAVVTVSAAAKEAWHKLK